jgi:hypothetical protein
MSGLALNEPVANAADPNYLEISGPISCRPAACPGGIVTKVRIQSDLGEGVDGTLSLQKSGNASVLYYTARFYRLPLNQTVLANAYVYSNSYNAVAGLRISLYLPPHPNGRWTHFTPLYF